MAKIKTIAQKLLFKAAVTAGVNNTPIEHCDCCGHSKGRTSRRANKSTVVLGTHRSRSAKELLDSADGSSRNCESIWEPSISSKRGPLFGTHLFMAHNYTHTITRTQLHAHCSPASPAKTFPKENPSPGNKGCKRTTDSGPKHRTRGNHPPQALSQKPLREHGLHSPEATILRSPDSLSTKTGQF